MGTRHLICVVKDSEYKVAQYGRWDGYPEGQGQSIVSFLSDSTNIISLKNGLERVRFLDVDGIDKEFIEDYNAKTPRWSSEPDLRSEEEKHWWNTYMSRNLGSDILTNIANSTDDSIIIANNLSFANDSLFCEWAYVVDLDKEEFEVYRGFNQYPTDKDSRFYSESPDENKYFPVKHIKTYKFSALPNDLAADLNINYDE